MKRPPEKLERLTDRDLWVLRQLRAKVGEWGISDRAFNNVTAHEAAMILRALDFAAAAEGYLREQERQRKDEQRQIEAGTVVKQIGETEGE